MNTLEEILKLKASLQAMAERLDLARDDMGEIRASLARINDAITSLAVAVANVQGDAKRLAAADAHGGKTHDDLRDMIREITDVYRRHDGELNQIKGGIRVMAIAVGLLTVATGWKLVITIVEQTAK